MKNKIWRLFAIIGIGAVAWNTDTLWMLFILWAVMISLLLWSNDR